MYLVIFISLLTTTILTGEDSQLHEDGFTDIATQLSNVTLIPRPPQVEPQRLFKLARQGRNAELGAQSAHISDPDWRCYSAQTLTHAYSS